MVLTAVGGIFAPMIARMHGSGEHARLEELYRVSTKWAVYVSLPMLVLIVTMPRELITLLFGARYAVGWSALVILGVGQFVNVATGSLSSLLIMLEVVVSGVSGVLDAGSLSGAWPVPDGLGSDWGVSRERARWRWRSSMFS